MAKNSSWPSERMRIPAYCTYNTISVYMHNAEPNKNQSHSFALPIVTLSVRESDSKPVATRDVLQCAGMAACTCDYYSDPCSCCPYRKPTRTFSSGCNSNRNRPNNCHRDRRQTESQLCDRSGGPKSPTKSPRVLSLPCDYVRQCCNHP
jgi:hypothetical protein